MTIRLERGTYQSLSEALRGERGPKQPDFVPVPSNRTESGERKTGLSLAYSKQHQRLRIVRVEDRNTYSSATLNLQPDGISILTYKAYEGDPKMSGFFHLTPEDELTQTRPGQWDSPRGFTESLMKEIVQIIASIYRT